MSKYPDVMKIQKERERMEEIEAKYPIIKLTDRITELAEKLKAHYITEEERAEINSRILSIIYSN